jgi:ribosomal protein S18 acetylase RimI-like enzyme
MVHPEFRRRRIATEMVKTAMLDLRAKGVKCVQVIFDPESETFFKRLGFHILKAGIIDNDTMELDF